MTRISGYCLPAVVIGIVTGCVGISTVLRAQSPPICCIVFPLVCQGCDGALAAMFFLFANCKLPSLSSQLDRVSLLRY